MKITARKRVKLGDRETATEVCAEISDESCSIVPVIPEITRAVELASALLDVLLRLRDASREANG